MLLDKVKLALRIDDDSLDVDIQDSIDAAIADLKLCGVVESKIVETDPLIVRAIKTFCKSEFSGDERESNRYRHSYEMLKEHLSMSMDYAYFTVTINAGSQCLVVFDGESKQTDNNGLVVFYTRGKNHIEYVVNGITYYIDVVANTTITVV